jgi:hypothetical protein
VVVARNLDRRSTKEKEEDGGGGEEEDREIATRLIFSSDISSRLNKCDRDFHSFSFLTFKYNSN